MAVRLLALLLLLGLAPGCFVFEELDAGKETMERLSEKQPDSEESSATGSRSASGEEEKESDLDSWWQKARTLTPGGGSGGSQEDGGAADGSAVVRCRLADGERFMRRDECLGRNGTPAG